jgi:DNA-binding GntR family transcriptional regulator
VTRSSDRASDRAYAKIRAFLLGGGAHPGEQVTEEGLAEIASKRAARRLTADEVGRLEEVNAALREAIAADPPDIPRFLEANRRFHDIITAAARSPRLAQVLAMLVEQPVLVRTARHYSVRDLRQSARDHDELVAAFRAGDPDWAQAVMKSHLRRAFHTFADAAEEESRAANDAAE